MAPENRGRAATPQVPEANRSVFSPGNDGLAAIGDRNGVHGTEMPFESRLFKASIEVPDPHGPVVTCRK